MVAPKPDLIQEIYQREGRRVFATLVRVLGSFELAEDALPPRVGRAMEYRETPLPGSFPQDDSRRLTTCVASSA